MSTLLKRIEELTAEECISITHLESMIGASKGTLSRALLKGTDIQSKWLVAIAEHFPHVSLDWLISGYGQIYKYDPYGSKENMPKEEDASKIALNIVEDLVPEIPADAAAGFTDDIADGVTPSMCDMLPRIPGLPPYDLTIAVRGDSMDPTFASGDRLALRRCLDIIQWGAPHVLDTTEGVYLKRIRNQDKDVVCISDNPDYPPFNIPKSCIRGIYKVVAILRIC